MQNVHCARSACKKMNSERRRGEENYMGRWARMDELTVMLVAILGGIAVAVAVVVNAATSSSLLCFGYAFFLLCFCSLLSTVFLLLCSGFMEVLLVLAVPLVAAKRRTGRGKRRMLLRFFSVFSSSSSCLLLCFVHSPLSFSLSFFFLSLPLCSPISVFFSSVLFSPSLSSGAEPGIFSILGYDINIHKLFFKINHSLKYIKFSS